MKSNLRAIKRIFIELNYVLNKKQKYNSIGVFFCMLLGSGLELLGVSSIYPFLQMMLDPEGIQQEWYISWLYDIRPTITTKSVLLIFGVGIILIYLLKNAFMILSAYVQNAYSAKFQFELSTLMLNSFLRRPYQFFLNTNSSVILRGIKGDVAGVYHIILNMFTILSEMLTIILLGTFLILTDAMMALSALALALACFMAVVFGFKKRMKKAGNDVREEEMQRNRYAYQAITGIKEITVADRIENFVDKYAGAAEKVQKATLTNAFLSACPDRILEGVCIGGFIGIVCVKIAVGTNIDTFIPVLGTFAMAAFKILPSVSKIATRVNSLVFYQKQLDATYDYLKAAREYEAEMRAYSQKHIGKILDRDVEIEFRDKLSIQNIKWKYLNSKEYVIDGLYLDIKKGESVALIGPSGAGKTTLADIIMGLLKPEAGTVEMDGKDIFAIPHQWARLIGYVPQSVFLTDDTLRNNVAFGVDEKEISDDKIWNALEKAQLREFAESLPYGLDTFVGERGVKFSGGQRQRVAIARALYENPEILVFDEATSALDNETEAAVMESIDSLQGVKTLIIIAHRLSTIRKCNKIYEVRNGVAVLRDRDEVIKA